RQLDVCARVGACNVVVSRKTSSMVTFVNVMSGNVIGGGMSGVNVKGMPKSVPWNLLVNSLTVPLTTSGLLLMDSECRPPAALCSSKFTLVARVAENCSTRTAPPPATGSDTTPSKLKPARICVSAVNVAGLAATFGWLAAAAACGAAPGAPGAPLDVVGHGPEAGGPLVVVDPPAPPPVPPVGAGPPPAGAVVVVVGAGTGWVVVVVGAGGGAGAVVGLGV